MQWDEFAAYEQFKACWVQPDESVRATEAHSIVWSGERPHTHLHICSWTTSPDQTIPLCIVKNGQASHWLDTGTCSGHGALELTMVVAAASLVTWNKSFDIPICPHTDITCYTCNRPSPLA